MIVALTAFAVAAVVVACVGGRLGRSLFVWASVVPFAAFAFTALQGPAVLSGEVPTEAVPWIPQLAISLTLRMDVLAWVLALFRSRPASSTAHGTSSATRPGAPASPPCSWPSPGRCTAS